MRHGPPLQFSIRQILISHVYLAILFAGIVIPLRWEGTARPLVLVGGVEGVAITWMILSHFTTRHSPARDAMFCGSILLLPLAGCAYLIGLASILACGLSEVVPLPPDTDFLEFVAIPTSLSLAVLLLLPRSLPRSCPICRRRTMVFSVSGLSFHLPGWRQFYWCWACGARAKRSKRPRSWEDTSSPEFDEYYKPSPSRLKFRRLSKAEREAAKYRRR